MAIDKLTPRQLNKDEDYLLVKSTEMVDALNVRMTEDDDGNRGVLKNIKGNTEISLSGANALPSGTNRVIGTCSFNQKDLIFYFIWNSNNDHTIYQIDTSGTAIKVVTGSYLEFSSTYVIHSNAIEDANKDILIYWTDGVNEPKKINISKCIDSNVTYPAGSNDAEKLLEITIAKKLIACMSRLFSLLINTFIVMVRLVHCRHIAQWLTIHGWRIELMQSHHTQILKTTLDSPWKPLLLR